MTKARQLADLGNAYSDGALSNRNLIINGSHIVNQRGVTSVTTGTGSSMFTTDRWISYGNGQPVNITIQEVTLPDGTVVNSHKTTSTTSINAFLHPFQKVEAFGKGYLRGQTVTISTWVRTNVSGQRIRICDTLGCYELGDEIPSDGVWRRLTATHTLPTNMGISATDQIQVHPAFGTTNLVNGSYIEFTLTQLEVGDTATPFEHRSYGQELALCQRYYWKGDIFSGYRYAQNIPVGPKQWPVYFSLPVQMRAYPSGTAAYTNNDASRDGGLQVLTTTHGVLSMTSSYSGEYASAYWLVSADAEL